MGLVADHKITRQLAEKLADRFGLDSHIVFIAPAVTESRLEHAAGIPDHGRVEAEERIDESIPALEGAGVELEAAAVGDQDPVIAIEDLLRRTSGAVTEIVLVTRGDGRKRWAEQDAFDRVRRRVSVPVTLLEVGDDGRLLDSERSDPGKDPRPEATVDPESENLPKFSARELAGMVMAIVGTLVLAALGAACIANGTDDAARDTDPRCIIAALLAVGFFLINVPHVLGLTLFQSTGYRGMWSTLFSRLSLYGTPVAVVVSAILVASAT